MDYHEEQEEDMEEVPVPISQLQPSFDTSRPKTAQSSEAAAKENNTTAATTVRYRECLKNHAVGIGGHAVDGCGEFMPSGEEGTLDALKCAACNCHRNFHRKEVEGQLMYQFSPFYRAPPPTGYLHHLTAPSAAAPQQHSRPLALPAASGGGGSREDEDMSNPSSGGGGGGGSEGKKRFRTRFTQEQKDRMLEFAERLGWRIQKHDEAAVEQFCSETGVQRHVLKVWMHNNKHTLGKKP